MSKEEIEQSIETVAFSAYINGKHGVSFSQWYTDSIHKDAISKSLQDFADQQVREYKENLAKKNSLDQFLEVNQKLVFTQCEKAVTEYKERLKKKVTTAIDNHHAIGSMEVLQEKEIFNLIDSE